VAGNSRGELTDCSFRGTPAEADHHAGEITREHLVKEIALGLDHHLVDALLVVLEDSEVRAQRCQLQGSLGHGLLVRGATGEFDELTIAGSVYYGLLLEDGADPVLRDCRLQDTGENGVVALGNAAGTLIGCEITGSSTYATDEDGWAQVFLAGGARTALVDTDVRDGHAAGVVVTGATTAPRLDDCRIDGNAGTGLLVSAGARPHLSNCRVADNGGPGLALLTGAAGIYDRCTVTDNGGHGVRIGPGASPALHACTVARNAGAGISAEAGSAGRIAASTLGANGLAPLVRARTSTLVVSEDTVVASGEEAEDGG
jgi:hypothetical protein